MGAEEKKPDAAAPAEEKKKEEPKGKGKKVKEEDELSEEDQQIKTDMELLVTRVQDPELALTVCRLGQLIHPNLQPNKTRTHTRPRTPTIIPD